MTALQAPSDLLTRIRQIWESARTQAARSVNTAHVCANWMIGQQIVEAEQGGAKRAEYGKALLKALSSQLTADYGDGFSVSALQYMRSFFLAYPDLLAKQHALRVVLDVGQIQHAVRGELGADTDRDWRPGALHPGLSWTHYRTLQKEGRRAVRDFYEIEAVNNGWSARQLERQMHSFLFERLAKSRDKQGLLALVNEGQVLARPHDAIKDPYVLEFLNLPESHRLVESRIEEALINQLQSFLLELGSGFAFVGRQRRLTLDGDHFYPDLVFYHVKLKCYVVIDLKVGKLTHGDLGQMQLYVHYYDREVTGPGDNPTIGLLLCSEKNDAVVRYVLGDQSEQIFASRYQFALPSEDALRAEIQRELEQWEQAAPKATRKASVPRTSSQPADAGEAVKRAKPAKATKAEVKPKVRVKPVKVAKPRTKTPASKSRLQ
ncbi:PDDEXK nuclease domain-containing protein [Acidovorax sp. Root267]|uniref:PDDEXK nuclease domain-containing protein n=1 Tax=Acidovorax sp. Root267 TaxID=1736505 RepID=UPI0009E75799|nr:PDDEXK nuclease domain-containing protein [Acidovorax sp. Root267]